MSLREDRAPRSFPERLRDARTPTGGPLPAHPGRPGATSQPMPRTVLLADDHEDNRIALLTVLEASGYRTLGASNGREAVDLAREHLPDLIVMDLAMPVMDGREAARILREGGRTSGIPVVLLTAMALSIRPDELKREGFADVLIKPCLPFTFLEEVKRWIGPPEG